MASVVGYKLVDGQGGEHAQWGGTWGHHPNIPNPIILPNGDHVHAPSLNVNYGGYTLVEWLMEEPPPPVPDSITRRQCALMLHEAGLITIEEALDMAKIAAVPAAIGVLFANLAPPDQIRAEIDFAATTYYRSNPLIVDMMQSAGFTSEMTDAFFIAAAQL